MDRITAVITCVFTLAAITGDVVMAEEAGAWRPFVIHRAGSAPTMDGKLDEPCWERADRRPLRHYAGGELKVGGSVALCYDTQNLYAALWLDEPVPAKIRSAEPPKSLWDGEVIEWFICPSEDGLDYVQLAWSPAGRQYDAKCRSTGGGGSSRSNVKWKPKWRTASAIGKAGWTSEAAFPFAELAVEPPKDGALWRINLCRHRVVDGPRAQDWSALSPTGTGGFHTIDRFEDVYFAKYIRAAGETRSGGPLQALIACWTARYGYDGVFESRVQLDRALGKDNVHVRVCTSGDRSRVGTMVGWPKRGNELAQYHLIVIANIPAKAFSEKQLAHLRRYVTDGGTLILLGAMGGWLHKPPNAWWESPLGDLMPMRVPPPAKVEVRDIEATSPDHPLLKGVPLDELGLCSYSRVMHAAQGAKLIAAMGDSAFIAETAGGKGKTVHINAHWTSCLPMSSFRRNFFVSRYYPVFWDNLIQYATGRPVPYPVEAPAVEPEKAVALRCDVILDNYGDVFAPGDTIRLTPKVDGDADYPYQVVATIEGPAQEPMRAGEYALAGPSDELAVPLPLLDHGRYALRIELRKDGRLVDSTQASFGVVLPLLTKDEFAFSVVVSPDCFGETDLRRIAEELKSIGFTRVFWLGGQIYGSYKGMYREWNRSRFASRMQEAGLRVAPVWYAPLYQLLYPYGGVKTGRRERMSGLPAPSPAFPGKDYLPYARFWLETLSSQLYGRMPLTDAYAGGDEMVGTRFADADTDRLKKAFEAATGISGSGDDARTAYELMDYKTKAVAAFTWLARSVSDAYAPDLRTESILSPNSFCGHASAALDVIGTASSLGSTSPDVYHYGEPKLYLKSLSSMAIIRSATEFGRLARTDFTGGQLNLAYYEEFPEQVFASLAEGARSFHVFAYSCASFEKHGRQDPRFAKIAKETTVHATRIGRTLNHYRRSRARVAMLYPHTAHLWLSMGKTFNDDYLEMIGTSSHYLPLRYGMQAEYDLLRRMFGHVDVLFDEQIQRGDLGSYDVCVVGYSRQTEARTLRSLRRFAESGGTLLVSTDSGRFDEHNQATDALYRALPAGVGEARPVSADYSDTRMRNPEPFSRGHALEPKAGAEVLFTFSDKKPACVRGAVGRGEAIVLGMPLAGLRATVHESKRKLVSYVLNQRARLISRPQHGDFCAVTFRPERGDGRIFMVFNGSKADATTPVAACGDGAESKHTLADIVTGEKIPFTVKDDVLSFEITCPDRWGRALALLPIEPSAIEVSTSGPPEPGRKFMIAARILGRDGMPLRSTLPIDLVVKNPDGQVRDDLSGVRVAKRGVYVFAMTWPVNALPGAWTVTASEKISGSSDEATWQVSQPQ